MLIDCFLKLLLNRGGFDRISTNLKSDPNIKDQKLHPVFPNPSVQDSEGRVETPSSAIHVSGDLCKWSNSLSLVPTAGAISGGIASVLLPCLSFLVQSHFVKYAAVGFFLLLLSDCQGPMLFLPIPSQALFPSSSHIAFAQRHILPKAFELMSPSPCASYLCKFQSAYFFHSVFPACQVVPLNFIVIWPCIFSASHQIFAGGERVSRWCPW